MAEEQSQQNQAEIKQSSEATLQNDDTKRQESKNDEDDNKIADLASLSFGSISNTRSNRAIVSPISEEKEFSMSPLTNIIITPQSKHGASSTTAQLPHKVPTFPRRLTANSNSPLKLQHQLKTEPLTLFTQFDLEANGTLTEKEFINMVTDTFSDDNSNAGSFLKQIKHTFAKISDYNSLYYKDNVHDLEIQLKQINNIPDKDSFLTLCNQIFGKKNDDMKEEFENTVEYAQKIMDNFEKNSHNKNNRYRIAKKTAEALYNWVEKAGIPAVEQNQELTKDRNFLEHRNALTDKELKRLKNELLVKEDTTSKLSDQNKTLQNKLNNQMYQLQQVKQKYAVLFQAYSSYQADYDTLLKKQDEYEEHKKNDEEIRYYIEENKSLKSQNQSFERQLWELQNSLESLRNAKMGRLSENEISVPTNLPSFATQLSIRSHGNARQGPNSDSEENDENDDETLPAFYSNESLKRIPSANSSLRRLKTSDSSGQLFTLDDDMKQDDTDYFVTHEQFENGMTDIKQELQKICANKEDKTDQLSLNKHEELVNKYNTFCEEQKKLVNGLDEKNATRDKQWIDIVKKVQNGIRIFNEKLVHKCNEIKMSDRDDSKKDDYKILQKQMNEIKENLDICVDAIKSTEHMSANIATRNDVAEIQAQCVDAIKSIENMLQGKDLYNLHNARFDEDAEVLSIKTDNSIHSLKYLKLKQAIENETEQKELLAQTEAEFAKEREEERKYMYELAQTQTLRDEIDDDDAIELPDLQSMNTSNIERLKKTEKWNAVNENKLLFTLIGAEMNKLSCKMDTLQLDTSQNIRYINEQQNKLTKENKQLLNDNNECNKQIEILNATNKALIDGNKQNNIKMKEITQQLNGIKDEKNKLECTNNELKQTLNQHETQNNEYRTKIQAFEETINELKEKNKLDLMSNESENVKSTQNELELMKKNRDGYKTKNNEMDTQIKQLNNKLNKQGEHNKELIEEKNKYISMNKQLNNEKDELNEKLKGFKMTETEQNVKYNQLIENKKLMKIKLDALENKYNETETKKNDLTLKLKQSELEHKQEITLQIKILELEMNNIKKQNKELIKAKQELNENMNKCNDKINVLMQENSDMKNEKKNYKEKMMHENKKLKEDINVKVNDSKELLNKYNGLKKENDQLNERLNGEIKELKEKLQEVNSKIEEYKTENGQLSEEKNKIIEMNKKQNESKKNEYNKKEKEMTDKLNDFTLKWKQLELELNNNQKQYKEILNKYNNSNDKCIESNKEKEKLTLQIKTLKLEMDNIAKQNNNYKELIHVKKELNQNITKCNDECIRLKDVNNQFEMKNNNEFEKINNELNEKLDKMKENENVLKSEMNEEKGKYEELLGKYNKKDGDFNALMKEKDEYVRVNKELLENKNVTEQALNNIKSQKMKETNNLTEAINKSLENEKVSKQSLKELNAKLNKTEIELANKVKEMENEKQKWNLGMQNYKEKMMNENKGLSKDINVKLNEHKELLNKCNGLQNDKNELNERLNGAIEELKGKLEELNVKNEEKTEAEDGYTSPSPLVDLTQINNIIKCHLEENKSQIMHSIKLSSVMNSSCSLLSGVIVIIAFIIYIVYHGYYTADIVIDNPYLS